EARQTVVAGSRASAGQAGLAPVQASAGSQAPAEARHSTMAGTSASAGQAALAPSQVSGTSQAPEEARHSVPACAATWLQAPLVGLQESVLQTLPSLQDSAAITVWQRTSSAPMSGVVELRRSP